MLDVLPGLLADFPPVLTVTAEGSLRALLLIALTAVLCKLLDRGPALVKVWCWRATLVALLLLPLFLPFGLRWSLPVLPGAARLAVEAKALPPASLEPVAVLPGASEAMKLPRVAPPPVPMVEQRRLPLGTFFLGLWGTGVLAVIASALLGMVRLRQWLAATQELTWPTGQVAVEAVSTVAPRRPTRVLASARVPVPLTWGWRQPIILLPQSCEEWPRPRLRAVLFHESAHVHHADWAWSLFGLGVCALYWFHPGVWWAAARMRAEAEHASDDRVLAAGVLPSEYATCLVEMIRMLKGFKPASAVSMARTSRAADRLHRILAPAVRRHPLTVGQRLAVGTVWLGLLVPLVSVQLAQRPVSAAPGSAADAAADARNRADEEARKRALVDEARKKVEADRAAVLREKQLAIDKRSEAIYEKRAMAEERAIAEQKRAMARKLADERAVLERRIRQREEDLQRLRLQLQELQERNSRSMGDVDFLAKRERDLAAREAELRRREEALLKKGAFRDREREMIERSLAERIQDQQAAARAKMAELQLMEAERALARTNERHKAGIEAERALIEAQVQRDRARFEVERAMLELKKSKELKERHKAKPEKGPDGRLLLLRDLEAQSAAAVVDARQAEAELLSAQKILETMQARFEAGQASQAEVESLRARLEEAKAQLQLKMATINEIRRAQEEAARRLAKPKR